ncbi:hypothetical protein PBI_CLOVERMINNIE_75 [Gordonia phage CloverMinnie]|nr:hypothetical protein PBI_CLOVERMINNIE_75 [Gordonia phage CloverMinnie]UBF41681.1 hypothetical protein SEA_ANARQUE_78 [Gordonia phage AnarQue]UOW93061.1 hypothetical protein SEA_CAIB_77 [Gordonia phage CaiB]WAB09581.1 hypothetical protein SEA_WOOPER_78 [Gordonia phage Wooper]WNM74969.1 hypothetical protein SEA_MOSSROSE_76 [Gordonia phage MossRose]
MLDLAPTRLEALADDAPLMPWETVSEDGHTCLGCRADVTECYCEDLQDECPCGHYCERCVG